MVLGARLLTTACVYRMPIQQGNYLDPAVIAQVKPGMTHSQVRYLLGTPMVPGAFDNARWDYDYYLKTRRLQTRSVATWRSISPTTWWRASTATSSAPRLTEPSSRTAAHVLTRTRRGPRAAEALALHRERPRRAPARLPPAPGERPRGSILSARYSSIAIAVCRHVFARMNRAVDTRGGAVPSRPPPTPSTDRAAASRAAAIVALSGSSSSHTECRPVCHKQRYSAWTYRYFTSYPRAALAWAP